VSKRYILAIDAGTSGIRTILYDYTSREIASTFSTFTQITPSPGLLEHDPMEIWNVTSHLIKETIKKATISPNEISAIGVTGQRSTVLAWDKQTGLPVHHAIVWQDVRTYERCEELTELLGMNISPISAFTKYEWLLNHVPDCREKVQSGEVLIGTIDSWLIWKLTEGEAFVTDPSQAMTTNLWHPLTGDWSPELADLIGMPVEKLASIVPSSHVVGTTSKETFGANIPIAAVAGDQQAAMFGHLCLQPGEGKATYGTSVMVNVNTGTEWIMDEKCHSLALCQTGKEHQHQFCLEGTVITGGASISWIKDLHILHSVDESIQLAESVTDSGGVIFIPALQGLGTPFMNPSVKGAFLGLTRASTRAHIARAVLEGVAFRTRQVIEVLRDISPTTAFESLQVDGGMAVNDILLQIQADVLGINVNRPASNQTTALGVAYLAGLATKFWSSVEEITAAKIPDKTFYPSENAPKLQKKYEKWVSVVHSIRSLTESDDQKELFHP